MKHDLLSGIGLAFVNTICLSLTKIEANDWLSAGAFVVIVVSNWKRFSLQIKTWLKNDKEKKKDS